MILSGIVFKDEVDFLEGKRKFFEAVRDFHSPDRNETYYRSAIQIYSNALDFLKKPLTTPQGLKEKMIELRPKPQSELPFVSAGPILATAAIEDIISYLQDGKPLIPHDMAKIPAFFAEFKAKHDKKERAKRHREYRQSIEKARSEQAEMERRFEKEHLEKLGVTPESLKSLLAPDQKEPEQ